MKVSGLLAAGLISLLLASPAPGAGEATIGLKDAVETALRENPLLKAAGSSANAANEEIGAARSRLLPKITIEERFTRTNNPTFAFSSKLNQERFSSSDFAIDSLNNPDEINDFQTSISIEQPLYVRKANIGLDMARKEHSATLEELSRKKEEVAFEVVRTFLSVQAARGFVSASEKGVEDAAEHLRIAKVRFDAGLGLYSDVLRAETGLREAEQRLVSSRKNLAVAKRALGMLLGKDSPVDASDEDVRMPLRDADYYIEASMARKDVRSLEIRYENASKGVDLARSDYFPVVGLGGSYMLNDHEAPFGAEGDSWQVSAFLRWSIFDGTLRKYEASKARYRAQEASEHLKGLKNSVSFRVHAALLGVEEAEKNLELAEAALRTAEEGERLVRSRYENSLSPLVDLMDAQASLDGARANGVLRKNDYLTALANLSFEGGTILKDLGIE